MRSVVLGILLLMSLGACGKAQSQSDTPSGFTAMSAPMGDTIIPAEHLIVTSPVQVTWVDEAGERVVRLAEIDGPRSGPWRDQAQARLAALLAQGPVSLRYEGQAQDRYERHIAHLYLGEGEGALWVQKVLIEEGLAVVRSYPQNHTHARTLLEAEDQARRLERGAWADREAGFQVRGVEPNALAQHLDRFQIIEGQIISANITRGGDYYLNFGTDWRSDFTIRIPENAVERFTEAGWGPEGLEGAQIRVRGWLTAENGPMIELEHLEGLEVLDHSQEPLELRREITGETP